MEVATNRHARVTAVIAILVSFAGTAASAQVAGSTVLGVVYAELRDVATGWSAKKQLLGQMIYSEKNERIGTADDLIVSPSKSVSYAIIGAGGFLGLAKHDVAIPVNQFTQNDGKFVLPGASKDALKAMPEFEYAPR
jgi:PRC-barrel domain